MKKNIEISVIIKTKGNVEGLRTTMESLEKQSLPFVKHIQVIFFLGKKAKKEGCECCEQYAKQYPENVVVSEKLDMSLVEGNFVNILWEGQTWEERTFKRLLALRENAPEKLSYVIEMFEDTKMNNYTEYAINSVAHYQEDVSRYFFSRKFDKLVKKVASVTEQLDIADILAQIIVKSKRIGVLRDVCRTGKKTKYKKRTREWYLEKLPEFQQKMMQRIQNSGSEHKLQLEYILMRVLAESAKGNPGDILSDRDILTYEAWLKQALNELDDYIINKANISAALRRYTFSLKYGKDMAEELEVRTGIFYYRNFRYYNLVTGNIFRITKAEEQEDGLHITGLLYHALPEKDVEFYFTDGEKETPIVYIKDTERISWCMNHVVRQEKICSCVIPHEMETEEVRLGCRYRGLYTIPLGTLEYLITSGKANL